jgi:hypothetical protein
MIRYKSVLSGRTIGRSSDAVCDPHHTCGGDKKHVFSSLASKLVAMVCQWFAATPLRRFLSLGLQTKWKEVCQFAPQNR